MFFPKDTFFSLKRLLKKVGSGGQIWTDDLRVMSPTSYQAAPPRIHVSFKESLSQEYLLDSGTTNKFGYLALVLVEVFRSPYLNVERIILT